MSWWNPFSFELPPRIQMQDPKPGCLHLNTKIYGWCSLGNGYCPECKAEVGLDDVFNNFLDAMRKELKI